MILLILLLSSFTVLSHRASYTLKDPPVPNEFFSEENVYDVSSRIYAEHFIQKYIGRNDWRYEGFYTAIFLISERDARVLVETGTARKGDRGCGTEGCSTIIFGLFAATTGRKLYSVDISENSCAKVETITLPYEDSIQCIRSDAVKYLKGFDKGDIDFLLLDSVEYDEKDPLYAQKYHLEEIKASYDKLHKKSIVVINNCGMENVCNCALVKEFLLERGWKLHIEGFVQVYVFS